MQDLTILADFPPMPARNIEILWREELPPISLAARRRIDDRWEIHQQEARAAGRSLFNAEITCLVSGRLENDKLILELAAADYKDFLVTVLRDRPWFLQNEPSALRPGLGNSAFLTHKDQALLGIRSQRMSAYAGRAHVIGGVLEKCVSPIPSARDILKHLACELREEAAIEPRELAGPPQLLALVRDEHLAQPELIWQCELLTPLHEIGARMTPEEHVGWELLDKNSIAPELWTRMTPVARCAWQRWRGHHF